ncbi:MAG: BspA family leucine-rich repeat surface protein [Bacteroidales bacterium]|nr:BspA family leucine-rich repeat surface protein [Bacteroidales bacterium]
MKKIFIFFALLAGIAVMTGCQKDQDVVTLKAVIDQDTKAYFGGDAENIPYWDATDEVYIKGQDFSRTFGLTDPNTTVATIEGVPASDVYSAIFPASMVKSMDTPHPTVYNDRNEIVTPAGTSALVYFDPHQFYKETGGHQQVDMPMGAVTEDNTLIFKNLCSIIRLTVTNGLANSTYQDDPTVPDVHATPVDFDVKRLTVQAFGAYLAGYGNVTLSSVEDPEINMANPNHISTDNVISVYDRNANSIGTITQTGNTASKTFDIVVPPFNANNLVLEVEMFEHTTDGSKKPLGYYKYEVGRSVTIARNKIVPITLTVDRYKALDYAYLDSGIVCNRKLHSIINDGITTIKINYVPGILTNKGLTIENQWTHATPTGWVELQAPNSPHKIYGYISESSSEVLEINSFAHQIYAHSSCSAMFKGFTHVSNIGWTENVLFETEDVTDMSWMFAGCTSLGTLSSIGSFNTTNVTNMSHLFDGSRLPNSLDLSGFSTHHVTDTGMVAMFKNTTNLSTLNLTNFTAEQITSLEDMFNGSVSLTTVDLSSFNTAQVTNMKNMFNGCVAMTNLDLSTFNMSNVSNANKLNMFKDMANNKTAENHCTVYCPESVQQAVLEKDANNNYYSGLDDQSPTGNYAPSGYWNAQGIYVPGKRIVFVETSK